MRWAWIIVVVAVGCSAGVSAVPAADDSGPGTTASGHPDSPPLDDDTAPADADLGPDSEAAADVRANGMGGDGTAAGADGGDADRGGGGTGLGGRGQGTDEGNVGGRQGAGSGDEAGERGPAVVFMPGGLPGDAVEAIGTIEGVSRVGLVESASLGLVESRDAGGAIVDQPAVGFVIPIDAASFADPAGAELLSPTLAEALERLAPGEALLSEASAELRRLGVGGTLTFDDGTTVRVAEVLPASVAGTWEVAFAGEDAMPGISSRQQVALVDHDGSTEAFERALADVLTGPFRVFGGDRRFRVRAVLPQIEIKRLFGEFAYRPVGGGRVEIDPAWVAANIVTADLPLLGPTRCHRRYVEVLEEVLDGLIDDDLGDVIDPSAFEGCWNPRTIAGSARLSRHSWGVAADINFGNPLDGEVGSPIHPELLDRMADAGATSGHSWTVPDPGHFELVAG